MEERLCQHATNFNIHRRNTFDCSPWCQNRVHNTFIGLFRRWIDDSLPFIPDSSFHFLSYNFQTKKYCSVVRVLNLGTLKSDCDTSRLIYLKNEFKRKYFLNSPTRITRPTSTRMDHVLANVARETLQMEVEVEVVGAGLSDHLTQTIVLNFKKSPVKKTCSRL